MEIKFVTSNDHKYAEMVSKLSDIDITLLHHKQSYPEIQADRIVEIARYSLGIMTTVIDGDFIIEDAGLEIDALNAFPGPYSSYALSTIGVEGILDLMKNKTNRQARFRSVIGFMHNGDMQFFEDTCEGTISEKARGLEGFGFDPIFIPKGYTQTFAELDLEIKNKISHRGKSVTQLLKYLNRLI